MRCATVEHWLTAYGEGVLPTAQASAVERHLVACTRCRTQLAKADKLKLLLQSAVIPAPQDPHFWEEFMAELESKRPLLAVRPVPEYRWTEGSAALRPAWMHTAPVFGLLLLLLALTLAVSSGFIHTPLLSEVKPALSGKATGDPDVNLYLQEHAFIADQGAFSQGAFSMILLNNGSPNGRKR